MVQLLNSTVSVVDQVPTPIMQPEYAHCSMDYYVGSSHCSNYGRIQNHDAIIHGKEKEAIRYVVQLYDEAMKILLASLSKVTSWSVKHCKTLERIIKDIGEESKNHPVGKL